MSFRCCWTLGANINSLFEPLANLRPILQHLLQRQRSFQEAFGESLPFQVLHDQVVDTVLVADVMKSADIGMV